jgi:hypothetical protein
MNIFESKSSSNNYAISVSSAENDLAIKQINEIKNDEFQIDNYVHINNMGVNSKSLLAIKSEMPNTTTNNRSKLDEYERSLNDNSYAENIGADESNEKNIEAEHLINNNDNIDMNCRQNNDDIAQKSLFKANHKSEHKNENVSNQNKEHKVDLENIEKPNLLESKTNDSDTTAFNKFNKNSNNNSTKMLKPSNDKHKRKSKSASSFIRRLFTCGVTSSCAGRRNSSKSSSSCHGSDRAIHNSNNAINLKSNSNNNGIAHNLNVNNNNNNKPIGPEAQIFSSNESIRNKFDGIKKYALASIKPKSNDSIANKKIDAMKLNEKRDSVVNKTVLNSSKSDDQYDAKRDVSPKLNDTNTNESSSKLVVPILKINDDIITAGQEEYLLDNEETEDIVEESIEDEAEDDDENDDLEEGDDDEDELADEDDEDEQDEAKLLKELTLGRTRDEYEYDEENEENNYDDYEDEDEDDEEEELSNHHKYFNINAAKKSSQHNSSIKQSSSASPVLKLNTTTTQAASKINNHKIPSFSFDSEDKDLNQSGCMDPQPTWVITQFFV